MIHLAMQYVALVFVAILGVLQAAAAHNNLQGLLFFKRRWHAYLVTALTTGPALGVFFSWNYHFATGLIEGSQQAGLCALSGLLALIFTLALSSLIKSRLGTGPENERRGLEALNHSSYFSAVRSRISGKR
jgi:hypothetical protein